MGPAATLSILVKAQGLQSTVGDLRGLDNNARKAGAGLETAEKKGSKSLDKLGKQTTLTGRIMSNGFTRIGVAASGAAAALGGAALVMKKSVDAAVDLNEQINKTAVVFKGAEKPIISWAETTADAIGISNRAALEATGTFGNMLVPMGFARKKAAEMSMGLVKLAADMASFNNATPEAVLESLRAGLSGETEPLRRFGVFLNEARVKAEALSIGLVKTTKDTTKIQSAQINAALAQKTYNAAVKEHGVKSDEAQKALVRMHTTQGALTKAVAGTVPTLTAAQKAAATYSIILKDTKDAQGDFGRTSGSLANQQRILKAQWEDASAKLGTALLPAITAVAKAMSGFITEMNRGVGAGGAFVRFVVNGAQKIIGFFTAIIDAEGMVARLTGKLIPGRDAMDKFADRAQLASDKLNRLREKMSETASPFHNLNVAADELGDSLASNFQKGKKGADALGGAITDVDTKFASLQKAADAALGGLANAIKKPAKALKPIGDGIGKQAALSIPGVGSAALMGANSSLSPFARIGAGFGLHVSSGRRPGSITSSGNPSYHGSGEAIDMAGSAGGMMATFKALRSKYGSRLAELIYTPGGTGIKDGRPHTYSGQVAADHFDHVHVALDTGKPGVGDGIGRMARLRKALTGDGIGTAIKAARSAGFKGEALIRAVAIAGRESGFNTHAKNLKPPDHSIGLWQINQLAHHGKYGSDKELMNAATNARAAFKISGGGSNWGPWSTNSSVTKADLDAARKAIERGVGGSAAAKKAAKVNPFEQKLASADVAIAGTKETGSTKIGGVGGRRVSNALIKAGALTAKQKIIGARIRKIRAALKGKLTPGTRLRLTQELAQRLGEHSDLGQQAQALRHPAPAEAVAGGDAGGGGGAGDTDTGDPNQALIDAINAAVEAEKAHTEALNTVRGELKRQTDFATSVATTSNFQLTKNLADLISGHIVGYGVAGRAFTPGTGVEHAY